MVLLPVAGALLYAGPAWANVLYRLITDGGVALLWLAAASGMGLFVLRFARLWDRQTPGALRFAMAAGIGLGVMSLVTLGLGLIGAMNVIAAWAMVIAGCVLGAVGLWQSHRQSPIDARAWLSAPGGWNWLFLISSPFIILALVSAMTPPGMLWTPQEPHGYDVIEYHLQIPREWYEAHRIIPLHHNVFSYFPFNVEMHYLLAMNLRGGPWAGMYLAQLMHLAFFAVMVVAVYGLARQFARPPAATIAALSLLSVPWLTQLSGIAYDEGGFLLFGILAIGIAVAATFEMHHRLKRFALAGAFAGLAAGSKLTAVPEVLVAVPAIAALAGLAMRFGLRRNEGFAGSAPRTANLAERETVRSADPTPIAHVHLAGPRRIDAGASLWIGILLFGVMGLATFSPWMVRNMVWAGNPVFPEMMPLGHDGFTPVQVERFEKAHTPPPRQQPLIQRLETFNREVLTGWPADNDSQSSAWQFGYLILPLGLVAFGLSVRRPESWCLLGLLLILTLFWLLMTHLQSRFFILAAPISALLIARINWRQGAAAGVLLVAIFAAIGWSRVNARLLAKLYGTSEHDVGIVTTLGMDGKTLYQMISPVELPDGGKIYLIGDARAFVYPVPMSRLRYRTVFDVKDGADIVQAWVGEEKPSAGDYLLIDAGELRRFQQTYYGLPAIPPNVDMTRGPYLIKR
ncbi:MAG TPA: hypothetical protein VFE47_25775 [Tepidisphaeraceae bacterium]|nr:hypothetical protein [Tepidisphaeraceae bacterium]